MTGMSRRTIGLSLLAVLPLTGGAVAILRSAPPPPVATAPAPEPAATEPPAPKVRTEPVTLRRGDTLVGALDRLGLDRRASIGIAEALQAEGADLRRMRPSDGLEVTWTLDGEPIGLRWEPSPWLGFAVVAADGGWEARRAETRPDVRVAAVGGELKRSLFEATGADIEWG